MEFNSSIRYVCVVMPYFDEIALQVSRLLILPHVTHDDDVFEERNWYEYARTSALGCMREHRPMSEKR